MLGRKSVDMNTLQSNLKSDFWLRKGLERGNKDLKRALRDSCSLRVNIQECFDNVLSFSVQFFKWRECGYFFRPVTYVHAHVEIRKHICIQWTKRKKNNAEDDDAGVSEGGKKLEEAARVYKKNW
jgi:hypothetical protein